MVSALLDQKGGSNTRLLAGEGVGGPDSEDLTESLAFCILCGRNFMKIIDDLFTYFGQN